MSPASDYGFRPDEGIEAFTERVFLHSVSYTCAKPKHMRNEVVRCRTFPEAMVLALHTPKAIVYAIAADGQAVCIERARWPRFLELYNQATGQRLKMPADPFRNEVMRDAQEDTSPARKTPPRIKGPTRVRGPR